MLGKKAPSAIFGPAGIAMQSIGTKSRGRTSLAYVTVLGERQIAIPCNPVPGYLSFKALLALVRGT